MLEFTNRYWFGEITNQDQGIEMFDCWKNALRNKDLFDEVHKELQEYDDELRNRDADRLNNTVAILTAGGFLFLPVAFAAYFLAVPYTGPRIVFLPLLVIFFAATAVFVVRKSAAIWDFFQDLLNPSKTFVAVCKEHGKRSLNYVQQVCKKVTGC